MTTKIIWGNFVQISQVPEISTVFLKETDFNGWPRTKLKMNWAYFFGTVSQKLECVSFNMNWIAVSSLKMFDFEIWWPIMPISKQSTQTSNTYSTKGLCMAAHIISMQMKNERNFNKMFLELRHYDQIKELSSPLLGRFSTSNLTQLLTF